MKCPNFYNAPELLRVRKNLNKIETHLRTLSANTLWTNGLRECMNHSLLRQLHEIMSKSDMKNRFWGEALLQPAYLQNITVPPPFDMKPPRKGLLGSAQKNSKRMIGVCAAYARKHATQRKDKICDR